MNKMQAIKLMVCAVLWTAVFAFAIGGTARNELRMMFWSGIIALVASCASGHLIAESAAQKACRDQRLRAETLGELIAAKAIERMSREDVTRIH